MWERRERKNNINTNVLQAEQIMMPSMDSNSAFGAVFFFFFAGFCCCCSGVVFFHMKFLFPDFFVVNGFFNYVFI